MSEPSSQCNAAEDKYQNAIAGAPTSTRSGEVSVSASDTHEHSAAAGSAFMGRSLGFLSSAAAAAGSVAAAAGSAAAKAAAEAASSAAAKDAIDSLGGLKSTLTSALKNDSDEEDEHDRLEYTYYEITLKKPEGAKLGLKLAKRDDATLFIHDITGGLAQEWNESNMGEQIEPGDSIVAVNGVSGDVSGLMNEVKKCGDLLLKLRREIEEEKKVEDATTPAPTSNLPETEPVILPSSSNRNANVSESSMASVPANNTSVDSLKSAENPCSGNDIANEERVTNKTTFQVPAAITDTCSVSEPQFGVASVHALGISEGGGNIDATIASVKVDDAEISHDSLPNGDPLAVENGVEARKVFNQLHEGTLRPDAPTLASCVENDAGSVEPDRQPARVSATTIPEASCSENDGPAACEQCSLTVGDETRDTHELMSLGGIRVPMEDHLRSRIKELESKCVYQQEQHDARIKELESKCASQQASAEAQTSSTLQQINRLQERITDLESDTMNKDNNIRTLEECLKRSEQELREATKSAQTAANDAEKALKDSKAVEKELARQVEQLRRDVASAKNQARSEADQEKQATIDEVRAEIEKELETMMRSKEKQVNALRAEVREFENRSVDLSQQLNARLAEIDALKAELTSLRRDGEGQVGDHKRKLDSLAAEHQQRVDELEQRKETEERHKRELAQSLRGVEERARNEMSQLEAQKSNLELQLGSLQKQHETKLQECAELSAALGEALAKAAAAAIASENCNTNEARTRTLEEQHKLAETRARKLEEQLQATEIKCREFQSIIDGISKESEMYRTEAKIAREERADLEKELTQTLARAREQQAASNADNAVGQQAAIKDMQKDFEDRMVRHREEVQYLRQKCDEKEKRCEQLLAEKSSLKIELRNARGSGPTTKEDDRRDVETGALPTGRVPAAKAAGGGRSLVRSFPLSAPSWLRSLDAPLQVVLQTLARHPEARLIVCFYALLLHIWVFVVFKMDVSTPREAEYVGPQGAPLVSVDMVPDGEQGDMSGMGQGAADAMLAAAAA